MFFQRKYKLTVRATKAASGSDTLTSFNLHLFTISFTMESNSVAITTHSRISESIYRRMLRKTVLNG